MVAVFVSPTATLYGLCVLLAKPQAQCPMGPRKQVLSKNPPLPNCLYVI